MKEVKRTFEVRKTITRKDIESDIRFTLEFNGVEWVYNAPAHQNHTVNQLMAILEKLKELNDGGSR